MSIESLYQHFLLHPSISTDTRKIKTGDLFFALMGSNYNGNLFAVQALQQGAALAVVDEWQDTMNEVKDKIWRVDDVLSTLQQLALYHRRQLSIPVIAITGSNGKTTTKELISAVLGKKYRTRATIGNLNNHIGVPLTLLSLPLDTEMAIIEMGANHEHEIARYCTMALPTHGLINNVGKAHLEGFGSLDGVMRAKGELYDYLRENQGVVFRNTQLPYLEKMASGVPTQITYGTHHAQYPFMPITQTPFAAMAILKSGKECSIHTKLVGHYNIPNLMAAATIGMYFEVPIDSIREALQNYTPDNSRSQLLQSGTNQIVLDAYNANPTSMKASIEHFAAQPYANKHLWIGAMKEMGEEEKTEHEKLLQLIAQYEWSSVILVGKEFAGLTQAYPWFETSWEARQHVRAQVPKEAFILIKGSRGSAMEVMLDALK